MKNLKFYAVVLLIAAGVTSGVYLDFKIWRLKHPQAPTWTYFL